MTTRIRRPATTAGMRTGVPGVGKTYVRGGGDATGRADDASVGMNGRSAEPERRSGEDRRASLAFHLTPREVEVLALVLLGLGNKEIGKRLGLAEQSIKDH